MSMYLLFLNDPSEEWQKRKCKLFTKEERMLVERFKSVVDYCKNITTTSQKQIAKEICLNSKVEIGLNQSMISKIYNGTDIPKCNNTLDAINSWIDKNAKIKII
ncbi:12732_t:CDS:2 [Entrophospora sp. SA101]|nr:574_t:CDS:2 [Entrophospora sp. SA101]CAJ0644681.1 12732_t:CDS:2 [Entrophospora sp. SA101]